jgi:hypothetical protein
MPPVSSDRVGAATQRVPDRAVLEQDLLLGELPIDVLLDPVGDPDDRKQRQRYQDRRDHLHDDQPPEAMPDFDPRLRPIAIPIAPNAVCAARFTKPVTCATAPQNAVATDGPTSVPAGTVGLLDRVPSIHVNGSVQTVLVFAPAGPLLKPASR